MEDLSTIAAREAEALEDFDGDFEANPLTGDNIVSVSADVSTDGTVRDISVGFNTGATRITVELFAGRLTAGAGGETHTTHVDAEESEAVLAARETWKAHFDGVTMEAK